MSTAATPASAAAATPTPAGSGGSANSSSSAALSEEDLRKQLRSALQALNRREPLEPTYKKLLERNTLTRKAATIPQRKPLDEAGMRAAFTLREAKEHEQQPLLEATLNAMAMHPERKRSLDGMALGLQTRNKKRKLSQSPVFGTSAAAQTQLAKQRAELERQRIQARQWEEARMEREREEKRKQREELSQENQRRSQEGGGGLQIMLEKVLKKYWDMSFPNLGGMNPFRIVIDRESAPQIAPDYFTIITTPMNLTYIKDKVKGRKYTTLTQFFSDIDLVVSNALAYNVGETNEYRIATLEFQKMHKKIAKAVWKQIKEKQNQIRES
eukprot:CAMPEP_0116120548 /NCGR_PEP_ID=MMETSP0329-20121206/3231_1 /TAXON_ID=697910 /ORGANISM="Pseudo-nitzschia arenysensis, Strain B593" /LENGTH=326 /DNA_ID=CAMNT_0003614319 /DNA_START=69 /DNA_END=1049 /DNA_ORIENTATION=+